MPKACDYVFLEPNLSIEKFGFRGITIVHMKIVIFTTVKRRQMHRCDKIKAFQEIGFASRAHLHFN